MKMLGTCNVNARLEDRIERKTAGGGGIIKPRCTESICLDRSQCVDDSVIEIKCFIKSMNEQYFLDNKVIF